MVITARMTERRNSSTRTARAATSAARASRAPTHEEIALLAHELYVRSGFEPGRDEEFWLEAERQLGRGLETQAGRKTAAARKGQFSSS